VQLDAEPRLEVALLLAVVTNALDSNGNFNFTNSVGAGKPAGQVIPPGPDDPIKARWLGIFNGAGIHGTTDIGSLVSRRKSGAVLHDAGQIAQRVVRMVQDGAVVSITGKVIKMRTDTVCIHGDTPGAVDIARGVRQALKDAGIEVAPFRKAG